MSIEDELVRLDGEIDEARTRLALQQAELDSLVARRESLARSLQTLRPTQPAALTVPLFSEPVQFDGMQRTDAIVKLLNSASGSLTIAEVIRELQRGSNEKHPYQVVASTLAFLTEERRIRRVGRGRYAKRAA
jgi:hypothetical protein